MPCGVNVTLIVAQLDATEVEVQVSCAEATEASISGTSEERMRFMVFLWSETRFVPLGAWVTTPGSNLQTTAGPAVKALPAPSLVTGGKKGTAKNQRTKNPKAGVMGTVPTLL